MLDRTIESLLVCLALLATGPLLAGGSTPVDHPCIEDPVFPSDCVAQLGAIGEPSASSTNEGYLGIVAPIVDPLLRLDAPDERAGRLYAVSSGANTVRVLTPDGGEVLADVRGCTRPSALEQDANGDRVFVSCHGSNAIGIIDTEANTVVGIIQDRDAEGRPILQEPMGMAFVNGSLYVASSQNNRIAVIDPDEQRVMRYISLPGQEPRSIAATDDGEFLLVANFLSGNRTEPGFASPVLLGDACAELLSDPSAMAVYDEDSPDFMDIEHAQFAEIAECYLMATMQHDPEVVVVNPARPDHDVVVVRLSDEQVIFTTDTLALDPGTLNYDLAVSGSKVYLATVHARNALNADLGHRPLVNRLVVLELDETGVLRLGSSRIRDLDAPYLDANGTGTALAATPYALRVEDDRVLIAAAGSDRLVVTDLDGTITTTIPVGFGPKGLVANGDDVWVYNATGMSLSRVNLDSSTSSEIAGLGTSPVPETVRLGSRLFESAAFAQNGTFSCASCHPDGGLDGLVWMLDERDGLRATMSVRQISETAPYHWDGSKCNLVKILQDGVVNLFGSPAPTECEIKVMIDYMNGLVHPRTPFRAADDGLTAEAALGAAVVHRSIFLDEDLEPLACNGRAQDMTVEGKILERAGDPTNEHFQLKETCGQSSCHMAPHMGTGEEKPDGSAAATFVLGLWDRMTAWHDGRMTRNGLIEAVDSSREYYGAPPLLDGETFDGRVSAMGVLSARFSHPELRDDDDPATTGYSVADASARFLLEEHELQSGTVGMSVALHQAYDAEMQLVDLLESSASQGKIALLGIGTIGGSLTGLSWDPSQAAYAPDSGGSLNREGLIASLGPGDSMILYGALLPGQNAFPQPKIRTLRRDASPYLCAEGHADYPAAVETGATTTPIRISGIDVVPGSRVLIDGQVTGAPLDEGGTPFEWTLPAAPQNPTVLSVQVLAPDGMLSNTLPLPVVSPVVPPTMVDGVVARKENGTTVLSWGSQFGVTGPGTQYDIHRGLLSRLTDLGLGGGTCVRHPVDGTIPEIPELRNPPPGEGYYFLVRAENQAGQSSWGLNGRDSQIQSCSSRYD